MKTNPISRLARFLAACIALSLSARAATFTVITTDDTGSGSLRQAVADAANTPGEDTITFAAALSGQTITLTSAQIIITDTVGITLDATNLAGGLTISGNNARFRRIFLLNSGTTATLRGLTLRGGGQEDGVGGAIYNGGTMTLTQCTLSGNDADLGQGGAIGNGGTMTLTQCTLSDNRVDLGFGGGAIYNSGTMTLTQCTLSGNSADYGGGGGAIRNNGTMTLTQCTLSGNRADSDGYPGSGVGGGISNNGTLTLTNSIVAGNTAFFGYPNIYGTYTGTNNLTSGDPLLAPLGNYGGPTQTMALLPGSPARNAVLPANVIAALTADQRGFPIIDTPDIGAYEAGTSNTFTLWSLENFGNSTVNFTADAEKDTNTNGLEYATRTNPLAANGNPLGTPARATLPGDVSAYQFSFPYRPGATDLRYIVYRSPNLATWTEIYRVDLSIGTVTEVGAVTGDENAGTQIITVTDSGFTSPRCFWKLIVENP